MLSGSIRGGKKEHAFSPLRFRERRSPEQALLPWLARGFFVYSVGSLLCTMEFVFGLDVDRQLREERLDQLVRDIES